MKKLLTHALLAALFMTACAEFEEPQQAFENTPQVFTRSAAASEANPYSLDNVQQAYDDVAGEMNLPSMNLAATHHYVRFSLQDSISYYILHDSLRLELIEYPLDRELTEAEMLEYMTDTLSTEKWRYTVVPTDFVYPAEVLYEFMDYIYMQAENEPQAKAGSGSGLGPQMDVDVYDYVIEQSMINNGIEVEPLTRSGAWYPSATVKFLDDYYTPLRAIPLHGVKVRCTNFINVGSGFTDANGNVSGIKGWGGKFRNAVGYHIIWEDDKWNIRDGRTGQGKTHGPKQKSHWYATITIGDRKASFFAAAHRALHAYYYENHPITAGLTKCTRLDKMNVGIIWEGNDSARFNPAPGWFWGNPIVLWAQKNNMDKQRWYATSSIFHELGHATHYQRLGVWDMLSAGDRIRESWANGVEYAYMTSLYPGFANMDYGGNYTAIVESLMNQGLTLKQVENTVVGQTSWHNGWKPAVKALQLIPNEIVDMLFNYPNDVVRMNMGNLISGANNPSLNIATAYSVPVVNLPVVNGSRIAFNGFTVSGGTYEIVNQSVANGTAFIKFISPSVFTISATFTLPGGVTYTCTKKIDKSTNPIKPVLSKTGGKDGVYTILVSNAQEGATFEWEIDRKTSFTTSPKAQVIIPLHRYGTIVTARIQCRAHLNTKVSSWSDELVIQILIPTPMT